MKTEMKLMQYKLLFNFYMQNFDRQSENIFYSENSGSACSWNLLF